jgi:glycosyltransferase involved in cell wall biosynthesis
VGNRVFIVKTLQIGLRWSSKVSGGAERVFEDLAVSLPGAGIKFVGAVAGPHDLDRTTSGLIHSFAPEDSQTTKRLRGARINITKLIASQSPDLLASHFAFYTVPILDRLSGRPFVMHFHGPWAMESKEEGASGSATFVKRSIERLVYSRADRVIVLSDAFASLLSQNYGIDEDRIRIVPGAVDLERFAPVYSRPAAREILGWPADRPILLSVRRLVNRMGLQHLVTALASVRERVPEVLLCVGGTGPMRSVLEQRVLDLGLAENIKFLGFLPEDMLPLAYRAADMSVVPTASLEGFGLVAAESLAAGTPAMVTPVGGLPEVVKTLSKDLIFRSGDPSDLAQGLTAALLGQSRLPNETECRDYAVQNFARDLMASRVAAVYRELVS